MPASSTALPASRSQRQFPVFYASHPPRLARQLLGDVLAIALAVAAVRAGTWVDDQVGKLGQAGNALEDAGNSFSGALSDAADQVGKIPGVGDNLQKPLEAAAGAGHDVASAGQSFQDGVGHLAFGLGLATAVIPLLIVLWWLVRRTRWVREATAARRLLAYGVDASLFALRALSHQPLRRIAGLAKRLDLDPVDGWRQSNPVAVTALAQLELRDLGMTGRELPGPDPR